jgi:IPT/TIG domain
VPISARGRTALAIGTAVALVASGLTSLPSAAAVGVPTVSAVAPKTGTIAGGTRVTVTGTNFAHVSAVRFGTRAGASIGVLSSTRLRVTSPPHAAGVVDIRVVTPAGTSATRNADHFTYGAPPSITKISPKSGTKGGGTVVTVTGTNLGRTSKVTFGTVAGLIETAANGRVVVGAPAHAVATTDVRVTTPFGTSKTKAADRFSYTVTPFWHKHIPTHLTQVNPSLVSCVTETFCLAIDWDGNSTTFTGTSWSAASPVTNTGSVYGLSCATTAFCIAVTSTGKAFKYSSSWDGGTTVDAGHQLQSVSCPTSSFCVAVDENGSAVMFNGTSWGTPAVVDAGHMLHAISCSSNQFCLAVEPDRGDIVTYNGSTWSAPTAVPGGALIASVSCKSSTFCAALAGGGTGLIYNGTGWTSTHIDFLPPVGIHPLQTVSCVSDTSCVAVDLAGYAIRWNGAHWDGGTLIDFASFGVSGVSCTSATWCMAAGYGSASVFK